MLCPNVEFDFDYICYIHFKYVIIFSLFALLFDIQHTYSVIWIILSNKLIFNTLLSKYSIYSALIYVCQKNAFEFLTSWLKDKNLFNNCIKITFYRIKEDYLLFFSSHWSNIVFCEDGRGFLIKMGNLE